MICSTLATKIAPFPPGAGGRGLHDRVDDLADETGRRRDLDLLNEFHRIFGAALNLRRSMLLPARFDLRHGHAGDPDSR